MKTSTFFLFSTYFTSDQLLPSHALVTPLFRHRAVFGGGSATKLHSAPPSTGESTSVPITVSGNNIDLTPSLVDYVNKKFERPFGKLRANGSIRECEVHLEVNKNPKVKENHKVEVTTILKGTTIRCTEQTPDMYASIDAVADSLTRKLRKYKERRLEGWHGGKHMGEDLADALGELEKLEASVSTTSEEGQPNKAPETDPYAPLVTKIKSFNLGKPIPLQEAIFALDYIDHDFYVFRNIDTNEVNVVYKRNAGGIGLIQPSDDETEE